jgi:hypothetical protein
MVLLHDTGNARPQKSDTYRSCMSESRTLVCVSYFARKSVMKAREGKGGWPCFLRRHRFRIRRGPAVFRYALAISRKEETTTVGGVLGILSALGAIEAG